MSSGASTKKPVNRKLAYMSLVGIGVVGALAIIAVVAKDPAGERVARELAEKQQELVNQPAGTLEAGQSRVDDAAQRELREFETFLNGDSNAQQADPQQVGGMSAGNAPALDPQMLRDLEALDAAQREVMSSRGLNDAMGGTRSPQNSEQWLGIESSNTRSSEGSAGIGAMYEGYDKGNSRIEGESLDFTSKGNAESGKVDAPGIYETAKPLNPPSSRVVNQGVVIPAVLQSAIDTRNPGQVMAVVSRTIYDSKTHRIPLIPQGSKLIGTFGTQVEPGVDRIPGMFSRLILPDGRAIALQSSQASALDGSNGIGGRYHSNIVRAVGPAFIVAAFGQWVDRRFPEETQTNANGMTYETPSVMQQVSPKISEAVANRYSAAQPYFTVKPGQEVRIILTQDIEVPAAGGQR